MFEPLFAPPAPSVTDRLWKTFSILENMETDKERKAYVDALPKEEREVLQAEYQVFEKKLVEWWDMIKPLKGDSENV